MTQEEKAKAYDEAIERAKNFIENGDERERTIAESIFAGIMEESEDERIRQFLIHEVTETSDKIMSYRNMSKKDVLAWLEKQGEQKHAEWHREDEQNLNACLGYIRDEFLRRWLTDIIHVKYDKPTNKVEQKFKFGDWVVTSYGKVNQVVSVDKDGDGYTLDDGVYFSGSWCDMYHLWTIQDAKDGDVLADGNLPFIFKKIDTNKYSYAYCGINVDGGFKIESDGESGEWTWMQDIKPATKEQRDLLFQKIKEAGYEWDAENKQLRKIEQNPAWGKEDETVLNNLIYALANDRIGNNRDEYVDWLKSLRPQNTWKPSDEQIEALESATENCAYSEYQDCLRELIEQLKAL